MEQQNRDHKKCHTCRWQSKERYKTDRIAENNARLIMFIYIFILFKLYLKRIARLAIAYLQRGPQIRHIII